jgi:antitoxin (DNA-binding transcriptional repressor) of toxin-antitoxin stability system/predicted HTH domain antitoxin
MPTVTVEEAQSQLSDLIHRLAPGDEVVITENGEPVAKLARTEPEKQWPCKAGSARGKIWMAPDFDAPPEHFKEYTEWIEGPFGSLIDRRIVLTDQLGQGSALILIVASFGEGEKPHMNISFEIPSDIEQELRSNGTDLGGEAREVFLIELYRQDRITHHQLAEALGLSRLETDGVLKRHKISSSPTLEELRAEIGSLRDVRPEWLSSPALRLKVISTLGILEEASHRGLVNFEKTLERLEKETSFYVSEDVLEEFRRRVRESTRGDEQ